MKNSSGNLYHKATEFQITYAETLKIGNKKIELNSKIGMN